MDTSRMLDVTPRLAMLTEWGLVFCHDWNDDE